MTTHTDRIRQMAQEAGFMLATNLTNEVAQVHPQMLTAGALARFAQLVAEDCAREMRAEIAKMAPTISEAAKQGESVKHVVEVCAAAAAFNVRLHYSLKD